MSERQSLAANYAEGTTCRHCDEPCSADAPCSCCRRGDALIAAMHATVKLNQALDVLEAEEGQS